VAVVQSGDERGSPADDAAASDLSVGVWEAAGAGGAGCATAMAVAAGAMADVAAGGVVRARVRVRVGDVVRAEPI